MITIPAIGQHKRDLSIVPHRKEWKTLFEQEARLLHSATGDSILRIEHTGSTAIPGMAAKPIIDITIAVSSLKQALELVPAIEALGYEYKPKDTVAERLFFSKEAYPDFRTHHLNITELGSGFWRTQITFRDYLQENDEIAREYIELKKHIADQYSQSENPDPEAKIDFVNKVLGLAVEEIPGSK